MSLPHDVRGNAMTQTVTPSTHAISTALATPAATDFVAVIPARLASTRLPDKPLADIGGKPMVVHVAERARASGARAVVVATDAQAVAEAVRHHGFDALLTRSDHVSGTDRLAEVVGALGWPDDTLVVNVQGDEPLIDPRLIVEVAAHLRMHEHCAIATAAHAIDTLADIFDPNAVKVVTDAKGVALYFSRAPIPWVRDSFTWPAGAAANGRSADSTRAAQASPPAFPVLRHIGIYAYRAGFLRRFPTLEVAPLERAESLEQLRAMWHGERIAVFISDVAPAPGVDTPDDLERARAAFAAGAIPTVA